MLTFFFFADKPRALQRALDKQLDPRCPFRIDEADTTPHPVTDEVLFVQ